MLDVLFLFMAKLVNFLFLCKGLVENVVCVPRVRLYIIRCAVIFCMIFVKKLHELFGVFLEVRTFVPANEASPAR